MADRGGWREEILPVPEIQASFLLLFPIPPLGGGGHNSGEQFLLHLGPCQSPTPSTAEFQQPQSLLVSEKVLQYTSNWQYPPICIAPFSIRGLRARDAEKISGHRSQDPKKEVSKKSRGQSGKSSESLRRVLCRPRETFSRLFRHFRPRGPKRPL